MFIRGVGENGRKDSQEQSETARNRPEQKKTRKCRMFKTSLKAAGKPQVMSGAVTLIRMVSSRC